MTDTEHLRVFFDPDWYLAQNRDVAMAGSDPWAHWVGFGRAEGRQPIRCRALELDMALWRGLETRALTGLGLLLDDTTPEPERGAAAWIMARWHASRGNPDLALRDLDLFRSAPSARFLINHAGPDLLTVDLALRAGDTDRARAAIASAETAGAGAADLAFARFLLSRAESPDTTPAIRLAPDLAELRTMSGSGPLFDRLTAATAPQEEGPLVSVIVPLFNAERSIGTALRGLLAQDWRPLEILVVDDASTDRGPARVAEMAAADPRIRLLTMARNSGAYPARNAGLAAATGDFVTVHDADDWSHPSKIRHQVEALLAEPDAAACLSHWMRVDEDLKPARWRMEDSWTHRNVSSLMMRIGLRDRLGFWDRVRANADTEYIHRIGAVLGPQAILDACPGVPLAFGRTTAESLTMTLATHARTQFVGPRRDYLEAAQLWHARDPHPHLAEHPETRAFRAPEALGPTDLQPPETPFDRLAGSAEFDPAWYLETNPDILHAGLHPVLHYLERGGAEGRDPGPSFSSSAYARVHSLGESEAPLLHAIDSGRDGPFLGQEDGEAKDDGPRVLVFAHEAGRYVFGAERSFIDILRRLRGEGLCPVAVLPRIVNEDYTAHLKPLVASVEIMPMKWRYGDLPPDPRTLALIDALIRRHAARAVHVNTLVLDAPLIAARAAGIETVVHVRELPEEDPGLCDILGTRPAPLRARLLEQADRFVANSPVVADWLDCGTRVTVRPNSVPPALFELPWSPEPRLRVGLVGSLMAKKGVRDFARVAQFCFDAGSQARFLLIGPTGSPDIPRLPPNAECTGYAPDPVAAIEQVDLVLSLSHFAESFGRTVLEAMAAGRPVIVYDRGAPPWLVGEGPEAGGLVARRDAPDVVARMVLALEAAPSVLAGKSAAARTRAAGLQAMAEGSGTGIEAD